MTLSTRVFRSGFGARFAQSALILVLVFALLKTLQSGQQGGQNIARQYADRASKQIHSVLSQHTLFNSSWLFNNETSLLSAPTTSSLEAIILSPDELMNRSLPVDRTRMPKLFHQSWRDSKLPAKMQRWRETCLEKNPDWEFVLWTDRDNRKLVKKYAPWFKETYKELMSETYRADAMRHVYMHVFGGVFADLNTECLNGYDSMFAKYNISTAPYTELDHIEDITFSNSSALPTRKAFVGRMGTDTKTRFSIPNAWTASTPGQPFWLLPLESIKEQMRRGEDPEKSTGPVALFTDIKSYKDRYHGRGKTSLDEHYAESKWKSLFPPENLEKLEVLPFWTIYPFSWLRDGDPYRKYCLIDQKKFSSKKCKEVLGVDSWGSWSITYWSHPWDEYKKTLSDEDKDDRKKEEENMQERHGQDVASEADVDENALSEEAAHEQASHGKPGSGHGQDVFDDDMDLDDDEDPLEKDFKTSDMKHKVDEKKKLADERRKKEEERKKKESNRKDKQQDRKKKVDEMKKQKSMADEARKDMMAFRKNVLKDPKKYKLFKAKVAKLGGKMSKEELNRITKEVDREAAEMEKLGNDRKKGQMTAAKDKDASAHKDGPDKKKPKSHEEWLKKIKSKQDKDADLSEKAKGNTNTEDSKEENDKKVDQNKEAKKEDEKTKEENGDESKQKGDQDSNKNLDETKDGAATSQDGEQDLENKSDDKSDETDSKKDEEKSDEGHKNEDQKDKGNEGDGSTESKSDQQDAENASSNDEAKQEKSNSEGANSASDSENKSEQDKQAGSDQSNDEKPKPDQSGEANSGSTPDRWAKDDSPPNP